jgi:hypothetical protein
MPVLDVRPGQSQPVTSSNVGPIVGQEFDVVLTDHASCNGRSWFTVQRGVHADPGPGSDQGSGSSW